MDVKGEEKEWREERVPKRERTEKVHGEERAPKGEYYLPLKLMHSNCSDKMLSRMLLHVIKSSKSLRLDHKKIGFFSYLSQSTLTFTMESTGTALFVV